MNVNPSKAAADESESEPTTVRPPFDPAEFARESERVTLPSVRAAVASSNPISSETIDALTPVVAASIPSLAIAAEDLEWFELPPLAHQLLRYVDGAAPLAEVCRSAGAELDDAIGLVEGLVRDGVLECR